MLHTARMRAASTTYNSALTVGGRRFRSARPFHSSARVCAKVKVERTSPEPEPPLLDNFRDLRGPEFLTVLPTPLPVSEQAAVEHQRYFPDSGVMARVAIVDACLTNFHDVPRAESLFAELRRDQRAANFIDVRIFNRFLHAYFTLAENPNTSPKQAEKYRMQAWELYKSMVENEERVVPKSHTSACMLYGLLR
jgi:hypothetical protein